MTADLGMVVDVSRKGAVRVHRLPDEVVCFQSALASYDIMVAAIARCDRVDDAKEFADKAEALEVYYRRAKNYEAERTAAGIRLRAKRRAGELLSQLQRASKAEAGAQKARAAAAHASPYGQALADAGISRKDASRFQLLAAMPEADFEKALAAPDKPTERGLIDLFQHHIRFTGDPEWYTPARYLELARQVMGGIDIDPASNPTAQETVRAERFYTREDDGLIQPWSGRVWLNPPYSTKLIVAFVERLLAEVQIGTVSQAILLTHANTDTRWFRSAAAGASALGFTTHRIKFIHPQRGEGAAVMGQAFFYFGDRAKQFAHVFRDVVWFPPGPP
jgi:phage N-6-adenine-methyltransferase